MRGLSLRHILCIHISFRMQMRISRDVDHVHVCAALRDDVRPIGQTSQRVGTLRATASSVVGCGKLRMNAGAWQFEPNAYALTTSHYRYRRTGTQRGAVPPESACEDARWPASKIAQHAPGRTSSQAAAIASPGDPDLATTRLRLRPAMRASAA